MLKSVFDDELYHYGRKFQKWGVRHGPPYPLKGGTALEDLPVKRKTEQTAGSTPSPSSNASSSKTKSGSSFAKTASKTAKKLIEAGKRRREEKQTAKRLAAARKKPKKNLSKLSDQELDALKTRVEKEKEIAKTISETRKSLNTNELKSAGRQVVDSVMDDIGKNLVAPIATGVASAGIRKLLKNSMSTNRPKKEGKDRDQFDKELEQTLNLIFARVNKPKK